MSKEESLPAGADAVDHQPVELAVLPRAQIVRSRTNPRTHFDPAYIQELATSIREHGILQPLLVRPLPGDRLQETFEDRPAGAPLPTHEIVCGECRQRGAELAGVDTIPVLVRHLTDIQVLQVQLVENLKRRDLHPLEEAEGFERLMKDHGMAAEEIAAKVDKSESYIYKTLKLLELTPECREQMYGGKFNRSIALLIATRPDYLQAKIAKDVMQPDFHGEPLSVRAAKKLIAERYELALATAVFDIKDAHLVEKCGACSSCPKRTGACADLFEDVQGPDACMDPKCFDSKKVAHHARVAAAAKAKGQTVIQGNEAKEIIPHEYSTPKGYTLLDEKHYINGRTQSVRQAIGKENLPTPVVIVNPHTKQAQEALPVEVADKLLKKATAQKKAEQSLKDKSKEPSKHELEAQFADAWHAKAIEQLHGAILAGKSPGITVQVARSIALHYADISLYGEAADLFAKLFDLPAAKVATAAGAEDFLQTCDDSLVGPALLVLMALDECERHIGSMPLDKLPVLQLLTADAGVDVQAIQEEVKADMKAQAAARKAEAKAPASDKPASDKPATKKPATKKPATKKPAAKKVKADDAKAGIAKALQEQQASVNDFHLADRVRFKLDLKGHDGKVRKVSGREGTIKTKVGDRSWSVAYGSKAHEVATADYTELVHVDQPDVKDDDGLGAGEILLANGVKLDPQPAWPFPKDPKDAARKELAQAEASGNKYRQRVLRNRMATQEEPAASADTSAAPAPNAAAAAWPFPTTPKKPRGKGAAA